MMYEQYNQMLTAQAAACEREGNVCRVQGEMGQEADACNSLSAISLQNGPAFTCMTSSISETVRSEHNKRPLFDDLTDQSEYKRPRQEDQSASSEKDSGTMGSEGNLSEFPPYRTWSRNFNSLSFESDESDEDGVDSPIHLSIPSGYVEDYFRATGFVQREEICSPGFAYPQRKPVAIGPNHQADLPECKQRHAEDEALSSNNYSGEDESKKWISNCIMPMPDSDALSAVVRPTYCQTECCCIDKGSIRCVRQHVMEARENLKKTWGLEKFEELGFSDMGEDVALTWTEEEEHLFHEVVSYNPASLGKNFWDELAYSFPTRTSKELVSYYFNVFMLRKRAEQNRCDAMNIDSDNDEWEETDDCEFAMVGEDDEDSPVESLTDQDDDACENVCQELEVQIHGESGCDYSSDVEEQQNYNALEDKNIASQGPPAISGMAINQGTCKEYADIRDESCTSFEAHHISPAGETPNDICEDHAYFGSHCDLKTWDFRFINGTEDFLSTFNVIEEVFGKGNSEEDTIDGHGRN